MLCFETALGPVLTVLVLLSVYHFGLGEPEEMRDAGFLADQH